LPLFEPLRLFHVEHLKQGNGTTGRAGASLLQKPTGPSSLAPRAYTVDAVPLGDRLSRRARHRPLAPFGQDEDVARETSEPFEVLVVLGAVTRSDGTPGRALEERLDHALALYHCGVAPDILVTGGGIWHCRVEAHVMSSYLRERGVPREHVLIEGHSKTTRENAVFSAELLDRLGTRRVLLITQPMHLPRAVREFRRVGLETRGEIMIRSSQLSKGDLGRSARDLFRELGASMIELLRSRG